MAKKGQPQKKKRPGRPATGRVRAVVFGVRMSPSERAACEKKAAAAGLTIGEWARQKLFG